MRYAQIRSLDISNGESTGAALFVQGCRHKCKNCFNANIWNFDGGKEFNEDTLKVIDKIIDKPFIKRFSFLGGEPLEPENIDGVLFLIDYIKKNFPNIKLWLYSGFTFDLIQSKYKEYKFTPFALDADIWLTRYEVCTKVDIMVDGPFIDELKDIRLHWKGSSNQNVIDMKQTLEQGKMVLYD